MVLCAPLLFIPRNQGQLRIQIVGGPKHTIAFRNVYFQFFGLGTILTFITINSAPAITDEVTWLINFFILESTWPSEWKLTNLAPAFNKGEDSCKNNYSAVLILTALCEALEKVMYNQM